MQLFNGASADGTSGGVAWWAHIGGFVAGMVAAVFMMVTHIASPLLPSIE